MPRPRDEMGYTGQFGEDLGSGAVIVGEPVVVVLILVGVIISIGIFGGQGPGDLLRAVGAFEAGSEDQVGTE